MRRLKVHRWEKAKQGWYIEPAWVSRRLFEVEKFNGSVYDPACGWGTILKSAVAAGYPVCGSDIVDRKRHLLGALFQRCNFLTLVQHGVSPMAIVCNPPFDHVEEFCRKAVAMGTRKVAMICLVRRLNAAHWLRDLPLRRIWLLTPRPSMPPGSWIAKGNKPGGGTQDFCWLIFERGYKGQPEIGWLHRDAGKNEQYRPEDRSVAAGNCRAAGRACSADGQGLPQARAAATEVSG